MATHPVIPIVDGETTGFGEHLNDEFAAVGADLDANETATATGNEALHGTGKEIAGTVVLVAGSGLSVRVMNHAYWIGGRRYLVEEGGGFFVEALNANETAYLYLGVTGAVTPYVIKPVTRPAGLYYMGAVATDGTDVTDVDETDADEVASVAGLQTDIAALQAAVGDPYEAGVSLDTRVEAIEDIGGIGGVPVVPKLDALQTTAGENVYQVANGAADTKVAAHVAALHAGDGEPSAGLVNDQWDVGEVNDAFALFGLVHEIATDHPEELVNLVQIDSVLIVFGETGDGSNGTLDYIDHVNTSWV